MLTVSQSVPHTAIHAHARCVLSSFGKNLYNIKEQNFGVVEETPQAKEFVRLVRRLKTEVEQGLDGDNVRVFLTAMGLGIVQEILDSVKAMRITRCGSMILMADTQAYEAYLRSFTSPEVTKQAALLVDLANMYAFDQSAAVRRLVGTQGV